ASFMLTADNSKSVSPGAQVTFPHTLVNTGNGADTFALAPANLVGDNYDLTGLAIYADKNGDGVADNSSPITSTGLLPPGGAFQFVIAGIVPGSTTAGQSAQVKVTATSAFDGSQTALNTDTATVTANAVISLTKAIN